MPALSRLPRPGNTATQHERPSISRLADEGEEVGLSLPVAGQGEGDGAGNSPEVGLADAREKALAARRLVKTGVDPIAERQKDRGVPTFGELADEVSNDLAPGFRNDKHKAQWRMTLTRYCEPIRDMPVDRSTRTPCCRS